MANAVGIEPEPAELGEAAQVPAEVEVAANGRSADIRLGLDQEFAHAAAAGPVVVEGSAQSA